MDAIRLLILDHARTHSRTVANPEGGLSIADGVIYNLDDDQLRQRPGESLNSVAWLIWHMARTEDMAVNLLVAGRPQVLQDEQWAPRLGIDRRDMAAGMSDDEVADFTVQIDITALRAYRNAVGARTIEVVSAMRPDELDEVIDMERIKKAYEDGSILKAAAWLEGFIAGKTKAFALGHTITAHNYMHLGEAFCLRSMMGARLPV